ncbi:hypothetical protein EZV62_008468 [Acer yangbiense]|uniref:non-specific serine/threonine protein kinase n=1 Tax=Acer yangbiense TaxID=1000413 RepID=A0A5C7ICZ0_9ROSI|nr:hypothetical protein EZV62_008468 [Acer yangbiense]
MENSFVLVFVIGLLSLSNFTKSSIAADTITPNETITHPKTIISAGGRFELGFFSPKNSTNQYVGIWYREVSPPAVVWVANREYPILSSSASLSIGSDGNIIIFDGNMHYFVTNTSSSNTTNATLLDSGNLILINQTSQVLWQSFDHPTDTLLPGMKLGYDHVTGVSWSLVSWNSSQDPAPGGFSLALALDPQLKREQLNIVDDSKIHWTGDAEYFKLFAAPDMLRGNSTEKSNYVTWADDLTENSNSTGNSTIYRIVLDVSGQLKLQSWSRTDGVKEWHTVQVSTCGRSGCGPFSICNKTAQKPCSCLRGFKSESNDSWAHEPGDIWAVHARRCVRKAVLGCNSSSLSKKQDRFLHINYTDLPINPPKLDVRSSMECESASLSNCSWIAYSFDEGTGSCFVWDNDLLDLKQLLEGDDNGKNFYLKLAASELNSLEPNPRNGTQAGNKKQLLIIVILTISLTVVTILSFVMLCVRGKLGRKGEDLLLFDLGTSPKADSAELTEENQLGKILSLVILHQWLYLESSDVHSPSQSGSDSDSDKTLYLECAFLVMENLSPLILVIGLLSLSDFPKSSIAADTITSNQSITDPENIISASGRFELDFFSPKHDTNYYLGIWCKTVSPQTVVWVANREYPILSSSASLSFGSDGNIVIFDSKMSYIVMDTSSSNATNTTLLDSGNLILIDQHSQVVWQSFDYPTDTLLPGMKLGYNHSTGISRSLVSWKSSQDPAPGVFPPRLGIMSTYVTWDDDLRDSTISRIVLDVSGQLNLQSWTGGFKSESKDSWAQGPHYMWEVDAKSCVRKTELSCSNSSLSKKDGFLHIKNADFPINPLKLDVQRSMECESASLSNCSWIAYAFDERSGSCLVWDNDLLDLKQLLEDGTNFYRKLAASELNSLGKLGRKEEDLLLFDLGTSPKADSAELTEENQFGKNYREVSPQTVVWVANREYPILSSSASLSIGNLILMDKNQNLQILWQSFDDPTDTFLPGMKLKYDPLTEISWSLVSWKISQDPALGDFSLVMSHVSSEGILNIKHGSKIYWSGDERLFNVSFTPDYFGDHEDHYLTWADDLIDLKISRLVLDVSGQLKLQSWPWTEGVQEWQTIQVSTCGRSGCGAFSICSKNAQMPCGCLQGFNSAESNESSAQQPHETWAVGARRCVSKTVIGCSGSSSSRQDEDGFLRIENADFPINPLKLDVKSSMDCESASLSNCSWIAYAFDERIGSCFVWDNELFDLKKLIQGDSNGRNFFLKLAASELNSLEPNPRNWTQADPAYEKNTGNKMQLLIIVILTISLTMVTTLSFVMLCVRGKLIRKGEGLLLFDLGTSPKADSAENAEENQLRKSRENEFSVVAVTDSISQGRVVMCSETIISAVKTIVWVANRDLPLTSSSPELTINNEGNLVIVDGRITYEVSDNALSQNTSAILLDSGNFVLRNENFDVLWQGFDYPSDTLLPGMKLGYSIKNKKLWSIRSWRDVDDPEVGAAELKVDPKRPKELFLIRNSYCSNYTESFCQCLDGFIPSENWKQKDQSGGCVRRIALRCEDSSDNSGEDRFLRIDEVKFPLSSKTSKVHAAEECKLACFNSCSCNAYAYNGSGNKQLMWIVALVVSLAVLLPSSYIFCRWRTKRKAKEEIERSRDMLLLDMNMSVETSTSELSIGDGADAVVLTFKCFVSLQAWKLWKDNKAIDLLENAADRPTMSEVVSMLTNELAVLPSPKQLAFSFMRMQNSNPHQERPEICSLNNITFSLMEAR